MPIGPFVHSLYSDGAASFIRQHKTDVVSAFTGRLLHDKVICRLRFDIKVGRAVHAAVTEPMRRLEVFTVAVIGGSSGDGEVWFVSEVVASWQLAVFCCVTTWIVAAALVWLA